MDFALNDEQQMLQESARRFFAERHPLSRARQALPWSDETQRALWRDMADMGWLALLVPEAHGGLGLGMCEAYLVAEAAGRQLLNLPLASSAVLLPLLLRESAQPDATLLRWVGEIARGHSAFGCTLEPATQRDFVQQCSHQLRVQGLGDAAQPLRLALSSLALPCAAGPLDGTVRHARLVMPPDPALDALEPLWITLDIDTEGCARAHASYRLAQVAQLLGAAASALDMASAYAREREQFGKPIGSYQAIKHQLADAWMALDNARLCALYAAAALDGQRPDWRFACAAAEFTAMEGAQQTAQTNLQVHGGVGFTWEHDAHLFLKRVQHLAARLGGASRALTQVEALALV